MRIAGFHIDGFGGLADIGIEDLSPGLVIVSGPNEAGKSTLLDFLTTMLFGFPNRRDNPRFRPPVRGGRHGGQLTLSEGRGDRPDDDRQWQIERYAGAHRLVAIRRPDGAGASEEDLRRALGGADEALFRAVFAVDLTELGRPDAMTRDDVRELLFSASIVGQRRSAARAMNDLQHRRLELARLRQGDAAANRLLADLERVQRDLTEAGREAAAYPARHAELSRLEAEVAQARQELDRNERRTRDLDLLIRLWEVLERKRKAEQRLSSWEEPDPLTAWLETQAAELQLLRSAYSGHLAHVGQLDDLCNQRRGIEQSLRTAMGSLGPGWDHDRVRTSDGWIGLMDEGRRFRVSLGERETSWRTARALAEDADAVPELAGAPDADAAATTLACPASEADPEQQARLVSELRKNLAEQRLLLAQQQASGRSQAAPAAFLGANGGIDRARRLFHPRAISRRSPLTRCAGTAHRLRACRRGRVRPLGRGDHYPAKALRGSTPETTGAQSAEQRVIARVAELAGALGLPEAPSDSDLETAAEAIEAARALERARDEDRRRTTAALQRRKFAHESLALAYEDLEAGRAGFAAWKLAHGLAPTLSPDGVLESLTALQAAWKDLGALDRVDTKIEQLNAEVSHFEARLAGLKAGLANAAVPSRRSRPTRLVASMNCAPCLQKWPRPGRRGPLFSTSSKTRVQSWSDVSDSALARRLRAELETGELLAWNEEQAGLEPARSDASRRLEQLVRAHQDASNELCEVAGSARVSELEQTRVALELDLEEVLKSWAILGCARLLLERTLRRHEQEHQPAVLARAGDRFAKVTQGRYTRLLPSLGDEGGREAIRVLSSVGAEIDAGNLSRGSVEQLYLCLRLGLAETFAERSEALPIILDDVLVNFDPGRAALVAETLGETAVHHQVLFMTCHPHLEQLVRTVVPQAQVVRLERI